MESDANVNGFCQRNLKPVFAILVVLIGATIAWAVVYGEGKISATRHRGGGGAHGQAASVEAGAPVDAVTMATPNGGIQVIANRIPVSLDRGMGGPARMQLAATGSQSRYAFNTVSGLILPCVVHIHAIPRPSGNQPAGGAGDVRFADPFDGVPERFVQNKAYENVGSGVIIDSRGFVLTNHHVISQAAELLVSVSDPLNLDFPAQVVAVDPASDLALLKVSGAPSLPEARLGNSQSVQVGDWVLAFGSPFGLEQTVTQGIISNRRDSLMIGGVCYGQMLQTDAPINRGSSGGPLVNLKAEVIGINSAIYGPNGVFSGTGFAIPVNRAKAFLARNSNVFNR